MTEKFFLINIKNEILSIFGDKIIVDISESAEETLEAINNYILNGYDIPIVISDYVMPNMYGDEFLIRVNNILPLCKKILLTGQATLDGVKNSINQAALYRFIMKPWDKEDLKLTISEAFRVYYKDKLIDIQNNHLKDFKNRFETKINHKTKQIRGLYKIRLKDILNTFGFILHKVVESFILHSKNNHIDDLFNRLDFLMKYVGHFLDHLPNTNTLKLESAILIANLHLFLLDDDLLMKVLRDETLNNNEIVIINKSKLLIHNQLKTIPYIGEIADLVNYNFEYLESIDNKFVPH